MADIRCPVCNEPWDMDCLHDEAAESNKTYKEVSKDFRVRGCEALVSYGATHNTETRYTNRDSVMLASVVYDIMGDDLDGAAAMFEDAEMMGLL